MNIPRNNALINPDDPKWTAYILGELNEAEQIEIERLLETSEEARALVEELTLATESMKEELTSLLPLMMTPEQRAAIRKAAEPPKRWFEVFPSKWGLGLAAAAILVIAVAVPLTLIDKVNERTGENAGSAAKATDVKQQQVTPLPQVTIVHPAPSETPQAERSAVREADTSKPRATAVAPVLTPEQFAALAQDGPPVATPALPAATTASLSGTVQDSSSALIPGVTITATNANTGAVVGVVTTEAGAYRLPNLVPGTYNVSATLPGFQSQTVTNLSVGPKDQARVNYTMQVAGVATQAEVSVSASQLISAQGATVGGVLPEQRVTDLPLVGNNVLELIAAMKGVQGTPPPPPPSSDKKLEEQADTRQQSAQRTANPSDTFAGVRADNTNVVRDGIEVTDRRKEQGELLKSTTVINPDVVSETRLQTAPVAAEQGRSAGAVTATTPTPPAATPPPQGAAGRGGGGGGGRGGARGGAPATGPGVAGGVSGGVFGGILTAPRPAAAPPPPPPPPPAAPPRALAAPIDRVNAPTANTEAYDRVVDNPFIRTTQENLATFSIDVDTASYANVRRFLNQNQVPPRDAVRIEELVNYFSYDYAQPTGNAPIAPNMEVAAAPWNPANRMVRVGIKAREVNANRRPPSNLVFLIDVSGSMSSPEKLPLVKAGLNMLIERLSENDSVSIVVYAGNSGLVLAPTSGMRKETIRQAIDSLQPGGSTNGASGIQLAYNQATANFQRGGVNRVILMTDGDFNVGVTSQGDLTRLIEERAKSGVFLSVLGFGMGNFKDSTLEKLADQGNGNYAYIDNLAEARKVLVEEISGTLITVAKDVKIQVDFNPARVEAYRLIGYENRVLRTEDFNNDAKDAGDMGAGHTVTALFEVVPKGGEVPGPSIDPSKYTQPQARGAAAAANAGTSSNEMLTLRVRYKLPEANTSTRMDVPLVDRGGNFERATTDFRFAASVAEFGMVLRNSPYKGTARMDSVLDIAEGSVGPDRNGYRKEFITLVQKARNLVR